MKRMFLSRFSLFMALICFVFLLNGCQTAQAEDDIVILYTNDVHCAVDDAIGYAGLSAYQSYMEEKTDYVTLVDCGDSIQGDTLGTLSQGAYLVDIMNQVGYDFAVLGNQEFTYGMDQLSALLEKSNAQYLGCNIQYTGDGESVLSAVAPYEIVTYGNTKVAFIGISTPESITKSSPTYFMDETGTFVYDFCGESGDALYTQVQETVDLCRKEGAEYVIALAHLGTAENSAPFRSTDLIAETSGIDAVLDGHSHSVIPCDLIENQKGEPVILSSSGTGLQYIGQLVITAEGNLTSSLIGAYPDKDETIEPSIKEIQNQFEEELQQVIAHSDIPLTTVDESGFRLIRNRETNLGDFCADAYRVVSGADIAFVNGGGIRADLDAGDITYEDIISVHPYGNTLCVAEATGQEILDALEMASSYTTSVTNDGKVETGESGAFLQVSGLRYTIDTSVPSTVELDDFGMFVSCGENRRVTDVQILQDDGSYAPIDPQGVYTLASHNYLIKQGGDGLTMFTDNELVMDEGMLDYQILIQYLTEDLGGVVSNSYETPQGRITIK